MRNVLFVVRAVTILCPVIGNIVGSSTQCTLGGNPLAGHVQLNRSSSESAYNHAFNETTKRHTIPCGNHNKGNAYCTIERTIERRLLVVAASRS
uniref:Putative secreted protein n=1 Tax=Anopheles marajoara TaxID=58244 RepID=A0A2M4C9N9_9DIPT